MMKTMMTMLGVLAAVSVTFSDAPAADTTGDYIRAIREAPSASAVTEAYAKGLAADGGSISLREAYIRRMADLGLAEMAWDQARDLLKIDPNNGLAWGVVAFVNAVNGRMPDAVAAAVRATRQAPNEPFVLHTAGQILAWYDYQADRTTVPLGDREVLESFRQNLAQRVAFADGYRAAKEAYAQAAAEQQRESLAGAQPAADSLLQAPGVIATYPDYGDYYPSTLIGDIQYVPDDSGVIIYPYDLGTGYVDYELYTPTVIIVEDGGSWRRYYRPCYRSWARGNVWRSLIVPRHDRRHDVRIGRPPIGRGAWSGSAIGIDRRPMIKPDRRAFLQHDGRGPGGSRDFRGVFSGPPDGSRSGRGPSLRNDASGFSRSASPPSPPSDTRGFRSILPRSSEGLRSAPGFRSDASGFSRSASPPSPPSDTRGFRSILPRSSVSGESFRSTPTPSFRSVSPPSPPSVSGPSRSSFFGFSGGSFRSASPPSFRSDPPRSSPPTRSFSPPSPPSPPSVSGPSRSSFSGRDSRSSSPPSFSGSSRSVAPSSSFRSSPPSSPSDSGRGGSSRTPGTSDGGHRRGR